MKKQLLTLLLALLAVAATAQNVAEIEAKQKATTDIINLIASGQTSEARTLTDAMAQRYGTTADVLTMQALLLISDEQYTTAISLLDRAFATTSNKTDVISVWFITHSLSECYIKTEKYVEAEEVYSRAVKKYSKDGNLHNGYADLLMRLGNTKEAEKEYRKAIKCDPTNEDFHSDLALCFYHTDRPLEAFKQLSAIIERDPNNARGYYLRSQVALYAFEDTRQFTLDYLSYLWIDQPRDFDLLTQVSYQAYDTVMKYTAIMLDGAEDDETEAYWNYVTGSLKYSNSRAEAIDNFNRALELTQDTDIFRQDVVYAQMIYRNVMGDTAEFFRLADWIIADKARMELNPSYIYMLKAYNRKASRQYPEAEADITRAINYGLNSGEEMSEALVFRSDLRLRYLNNPTGAGLDLDSAVLYNPDNAWALMELGKHYAAYRGDSKKANACFEHILEVDTVAEAGSCRQYALLMLGDNIDAERWQHALLANASKDELGSTYYNAACFYAIMGNRTQAIDYLMKAVDERAVDCDMLRTDRDFDLIRQTPEFRSIEKVACADRE